MGMLNETDEKTWNALPLLVNELDASTSKPRMSRLLHPYIDYLVSELSLVADCWTQMHLYQPYAAHFSHIRQKHQANFIEYQEELSKVLGLIQKVAVDVAKSPSATFFYGGIDYPNSTPRTEETVRKRTDAENHLDKMWTGFQRVLRERFAQAQLEIPPLMVEQIAYSRMERTMSWQADAQDLEQARAAVAKEAPAAKEAKRGEKRARGGGRIFEPRKRNKIIGLPDPNRPDPPRELRPQDATPAGREEYRHRLNAADWEVARALFHCPGEVPPTSINFRQLCTFMVNLGFEVVSAEGSRTAFHPPPMLDARRQDVVVEPGLRKGTSITLHAPHGESIKAGLRRSRGWGRNLTGMYWFEGRMFQGPE